MMRRVLKEITRKSGFKFYKFHPTRAEHINIPEGSQLKIIRVGPEPQDGFSDTRPWGVIPVKLPSEDSSRPKPRSR